MTRQSYIYCEFSCDFFFFPSFFFHSGFASFWTVEKNGKVTLCAALLLYILAWHMPFFKIPLYFLLLIASNGFQIPSSRTQLISILYFYLISRFALSLLTVYFSTSSSIYQVLFWILILLACGLKVIWTLPAYFSNMFLYWNLLTYTVSCDIYSCSVPREIAFHWQRILVITFNLCASLFFKKLCTH